MEIVDYQGHLANGGKKDRSFIRHKYLDHMKKFDPAKKLSDKLMFDGASNFYLGGKLLKVYYPKLTAIHGVVHTMDGNEPFSITQKNGNLTPTLFVVNNQLFSWIIFIIDCICILTGLPGYFFYDRIGYTTQQG